MKPVILSGGSGTRLWPLSRELYPKQFLTLQDKSASLFQSTLKRLEGLAAIDEAPLVVANTEHRFLAAEQMREIGVDNATILLEPEGRNTAPALAAAALHVQAANPESLLLVLPADHVIGQPDKFHQAVEAGREAAQAGKLITFGIVPHSPETGYGYIKAEGMNGSQPTNISAFVEKPDAGKAAEFLASGQYFWNSGMFLLRADRYLEELARYAPDVLEAVKTSAANAQRDLDFIRLDAEEFRKSPSISIDYAVMEHTRDAAVVPLDAEWSDVGSWSALAAATAVDDNGNVLSGDTLVEDTERSLIRAESRLVATLGLRDHIVVETSDAVLVAHSTRAQDVKRLVAQLRAAGRTEPLVHKRVNRPWGWYEGMVDGDRFQVKRISVKPGASLSLQKHHHRAEHWIVVRGTAEVTRGDEQFLLSEDQSTYIPIGTRHRLHNPGHIPLELIEVQTGSYLGEDDIIRYEDSYGRSEQQPG